jgi:rare lipoprotein A
VRIFVRSVLFACAFFLFSETTDAALAAKKETAEAVKAAPKKEAIGPAKAVPKKESAGTSSAVPKKNETAGKKATAGKEAAEKKSIAAKAVEAALKAKEAASKKVKEAASKSKDKVKVVSAALRKKLPPPGLSGIASVYVYKKRSRSASGEIINFKTMVAAHRTFRFGTKVKVTNRRNGKSVIVRIIDRGPFIRGRVIDLSPAAAREIGMGWGIAPVTLAVIGKA